MCCPSAAQRIRRWDRVALRIAGRLWSHFTHHFVYCIVCDWRALSLVAVLRPARKRRFPGANETFPAGCFGLACHLPQPPAIEICQDRVFHLANLSGWRGWDSHVHQHEIYDVCQRPNPELWQICCHFECAVLFLKHMCRRRRSIIILPWHMCSPWALVVPIGCARPGF